MFLNEQQLCSFREKGYLVVDDCISENQIRRFQQAFQKLLSCQLNHYNIEKSNCLTKNINSGLLYLFENHPALLTHIQRTTIKMPEFLAISSQEKIADSIKQLLPVSNTDPLYLISNAIVFSFPSCVDKTDHNFHTGWHDDIFWTIPESHFMHIWIPLLNDANEDTGTLRVCPGSHLANWKGRHQVHPEAPFNYRFSIKQETVDQYSPVSVNVKKGQVLFFHSQLIHPSGTNRSKNKVRAAMLGLYHDATNKKFAPFTPALKYANKTPEQWFYELYHDESIKPLIEEQLDTFDTSPGGI